MSSSKRSISFIAILGSAILTMFSMSSFAASYDSAPKVQKQKAKLEVAIFAGGCFWCMEKPFDQLTGVLSTISGYTGGHQKNPTYRQVSSGTTGHTEAIKISYDPTRISYAQLLSVFWKNIDPLDAKGQFCDKGSQYRSGIFYTNQQQLRLALASKKKLQQRAGFNNIATEITAASTFYPAEEYHQNYYKKNPIRYRYYRHGCGRDARLKALWGEAKKTK